MSELHTYLLAGLPGWLLIAGIGWAAVRWWNLPMWVAVAIAAGWTVKDLLLFPSMRRYYRSEAAQQRMHGEQGIALSTLDPDGLVRVHGEIWQARVAGGDESLPQGVRIRVRGVAGLQLTVERDPEAPPPSRA